MAPATAAIDALQKRLNGEVLLPSTPEYHAVRQVFNARENRRPALIARCRGADDVMASVAFARDQDRRVSVKGGGHGATGFAVCDDGLLIDLSLMRGVSVNPVARTATVQGGALWKDVYREAALFGLVPMGGDCDMVGVGGSTLGGGWGYLSRSAGLAIDNLESVQLVTADGRLMTASATDHPDLFWALRGGGGGNFGVVTSFVFRLHPLPEEVFAGTISWPNEQAGRVLEAYRDFVPTAPDTLYVDFDLETSPDAGMDVSVSCVYRGSGAEGRKALAPLLDAVEPSKIQLAMRTFGSFLTEYAETIVQGQLQVWKSAFLRPKFDAQTVDTIVDYFGRAPRQSSPVLFIETVGGAISRADARDSAYPHRHELMCLTFIGVWDDVAQTAVNDEWARQFRAALTPGTTGGVYVNYADAELKSWPAAYYGGSYQRLVQVKRQYDPGNLFRFPQSIGS